MFAEMPLSHDSAKFIHRIPKERRGIWTLPTLMCLFARFSNHQLPVWPSPSQPLSQTKPQGSFGLHMRTEGLASKVWIPPWNPCSWGQRYLVSTVLERLQTTQLKDPPIFVYTICLWVYAPWRFSGPLDSSPTVFSRSHSRRSFNALSLLLWITLERRLFGSLWWSDLPWWSGVCRTAATYSIVWLKACPSAAIQDVYLANPNLAKFKSMQNTCYTDIYRQLNRIVVELRRIAGQLHRDPGMTKRGKTEQLGCHDFTEKCLVGSRWVDVELCMVHAQCSNFHFISDGPVMALNLSIHWVCSTALTHSLYWKPGKKVVSGHRNHLASLPVVLYFYIVSYSLLDRIHGWLWVCIINP